MSDFPEVWARAWPRCWPLGHMLRRQIPQHWLRVHSLPDAKRYAETDIELQSLLSRQNAIAAAVLGVGSCWLVQSQWVLPAGTIDASGDVDLFRAIRDYAMPFAFTFAEAGVGTDDVRFTAHAVETSWVHGAFDALLADIAEWRAGPTLWMSSRTGNIFAPYDGGMDLFFSQPKGVGEIRANYPDWVSDRVDGL